MTLQRKANTSFPASNRPPASGKVSLTHARIDADLKKFEQEGGKIERLGNTPALKK